MESYDTQKFPGQTGPVGMEGTLQPGTVLQNRYRITGILGVGGMGAVYQARDLHFPAVKRLVAIKEMLNISSDPQVKEMTMRNFEREADILASLSHPAVPKIYDYFSIKDRAYLVMEYINGQDLEAMINKTPDFLPVKDVIKWAIELCDVLHFLHTHEPPIIFRDMKPSNVMIDEHGMVRLIDFGIAKTFQVGMKHTMIGTEGYSPPEQYKGEASPRGDIYALGATLHHVLTKRDPRLEPPFSFQERPIRGYNPDVPPELEAIIMRALAYSPDDRYPTAEAMKQALEKLLQPSAMNIHVGGSAGPSAGAKPVTSFFSSAGGVVPLWKFQCEDEVRSSPVVYGKSVYVGCYDNNLYCLNRADGAFNWKYPTDAGIASSPAVADGVVYIGSDDQALYAISADTGRIHWTFPVKAPVRSSPRVALGHVFFGAEDGQFYALKAPNGRMVWKYTATGPIRCKAWVTDERVYFGCQSGDFYGLDLSGSMKWRFKAKRAVISSPYVYEGIVYFGSMDWHVYAVDGDSGWSVWRYRTNKPVVSSPVVAEKKVFIGSADGHLYAIDAQTGKEKWKFETEGQVNSSPAYADGAIYFGSTDNHVYCVDAKTGKLRWKFKTGGMVVSSPTVADGVVYIGSMDHYVYALMA